ncbi:hypothetical protein [Acidithiobacillus ferrivorans]|uniref:hypothetical protein n=1 Tax=Acidithiobacillus ferrivorans TaxID=160808 RepID=UPI001E3D7FD3|nr:hypothetical protein [Acidithiobacillus ferrivorans]
MKYLFNVMIAYDLNSNPAISNEQAIRGRYSAICGSWRISAATIQAQLPTLAKITVLNMVEDPASCLFACMGDRKKYSRYNSSNIHADSATNSKTADTVIHHLL